MYCFEKKRAKKMQHLGLNMDYLGSCNVLKKFLWPLKRTKLENVVVQIGGELHPNIFFQALTDIFFSNQFFLEKILTKCLAFPLKGIQFVF